VNLLHLRAFLWLRWRLRVNGFKRAGTVNAVLMAILAVLGFILAGVLFVVCLLVGLFALDEAAPDVFLYVWDGLVVAFLFFWFTGLLTDLQRAEPLSLDKFLHLPVSLSGAFLVNYLSSLLSMNLVVFLPAVLGMILGLVFSRGPAMLLLLPLAAAFFLMVTALTHQFQGWLATLMTNPRRRRTVVVVVTMVFILLVQLPNLLNLMYSGKMQSENDRKTQKIVADYQRGTRQTNQQAKELAELQRSFQEGKIDLPTFQRRMQRLQEMEAKENEQQARIEQEAKEQQARTGAEDRQHLAETFRTVNLFVPPGWLPLGAMGLAEGNAVPALLGMLGMGLIGAASLWRSYRTTVRLYRGEFTAGKRGRTPVAAPPPSDGKRPVRLLEWRLPGLSEHAAVIALGGFRSLLRSPEGKMMLLSPVLLVVISVSMLLTQAVNPPEALRPLMPFGAMALILLGMVGLVSNQFGFDRGGFRVFVLCPAPRREVLLGKNLAVAPLALGIGLLMTLLVEVLYPLRWDYFLAALPQLLSMFLVFCMLANLLSIVGPLHVPAGSFRPSNFKATSFLLQIAFLMLFPIAVLPMLLPWMVQELLEAQGWAVGVPVGLALAVLECAAVVFLYRLVLAGEGALLQLREQSILDVVAGKAE
jgi:ABC-2 type transport system permease protein